MIDTARMTRRFVESCREFVLFFLAIFFSICYTVLATQVNINQLPRMYFYLGKNACSVFAFLGIGRKLVSQQSELCIFRCVASAAHFLFLEVFIWEEH